MTLRYQTMIAYYTVWEAWYRESRAQNNLHLLQPGIDGEIIPDVPQNVLRRGEDLDIPILIGVTSQDYLPVLLYEMALRWGLRNEKRGRSKVYGYFFDRALPTGPAFRTGRPWAGVRRASGSLTGNPVG